MKTVSLSMNEIIAILDPINQDAYNRLQLALETKVGADIGDEKWLRVWNSDEWRIKLTLEYDEDAEGFLSF